MAPLAPVPDPLDTRAITFGSRSSHPGMFTRANPLGTSSERAMSLLPPPRDSRLARRLNPSRTSSEPIILRCWSLSFRAIDECHSDHSRLLLSGRGPLDRGGRLGGDLWLAPRPNSSSSAFKAGTPLMVAASLSLGALIVATYPSMVAAIWSLIL